MARRPRDKVIDALFERIVDVLERQNTSTPNRGLSEFRKNKPSQFHSGFNLDGTQLWIEELEKIFEAMACTDEEKVMYVVYMLIREAKHWWRFARQQLEVKETHIGWLAFRRHFLEKYFPKDIRRRREQEFLNLRQGRMSVGEYAAKFDELSRCRIFEDDTKAYQASWKGTGPPRQVNASNSRGRESQEKRKPYFNPSRFRGNNFSGNQGSSVGSVNHSNIRCNNCLPTSLMKCDVLVSTPTNSSVIAHCICLNCPLHIDEVFLVNLICLPLFEIDIILGMDWLSVNRVLIDCQKRTLILNPQNDKVEDSNLDGSKISTVSVTKKDATQMFMILASKDNKDNPPLDKLPIV
ncbi:uncharacterized protein LOC113866779 [Abrus precatorius]|uniref:Uncharacterized protein LOC113866779 n=1 Tax=Abrus precatorius TaxID=3816 RepID=A0A8B8LMA0_ABRPR|nr:uncharacterized protein LOC113866779 [Abrus precatorius]